MTAKITASADGLSGSLAVGANEAFKFKPVGGGLELSQDGIAFQTVDTDGKVTFPQGIVGLRSQSETKNAAGTALDFTIPTWAKNISVDLNQFGTAGTSNIICQLGTDSVDTTGYSGQSWTGGGAGSGVITTGMSMSAGSPAATWRYVGRLLLNLLTGGAWVSSCQLALTNSSSAGLHGCSVSPAFAQPINILRIKSSTDATLTAGSVTVTCKE